MVIGQAESLLIAGNSVQAVEKVVLRLSGGALPVLGDLAAYNSDHQAFFRNASAYAWINARTLSDLLCRCWAQRKDNPDAPTPVEDIPPERLLAACGLTGLKTIALSIEGLERGPALPGLFRRP